MPGAYKRKSDRARGKAGKWTAWWVGADGRKHTCPGTTDKDKTLEIARAREAEARLVREGLVDPNERKRREAGLKAVADHVEDYRLSLLAKGDRPKHAGHTAGAILRVLADAAVTTVADLAPDRVQAALGRLKAAGRSARTCNHAAVAVKAFARWLVDSGRIREAPPGLLAIPPYNEKADRRRVRRALSADEIGRVLRAAEAGAVVRLSRRGYQYAHREISGPDRAALYRIAMATGFRANELRSLTPERFDLDGPEPTITVLACYSKRGRDDRQPIRRDFAAALRPWLAGRDPGKPVLDVPEKTAKLLRHDLEAAGVPYRDGQGRVADFHCLRHSYITQLVRQGVNPKIVQKLARHSSISLTLDRYTSLDDGDLRAALEGEG